MIHLEDGSNEEYSGCILGVHAPDALRLLGNQATPNERRVLGAFQYVYRFAPIPLSIMAMTNYTLPRKSMTLNAGVCE